MAPETRPLTIRSIMAGYPVVWREPPGPPYAGSLVFGRQSIRLDGVSEGRREVCELPFGELVRVRSATIRERLGRRPTLVIEARPARLLELVSITGAGELREVADRLALAISGD